MADANDGDWGEGVPIWFSKYVFPNRETFWLAVLERLEPVPLPWLQKVNGEVLEGLVMLHAAARADQATAERLKSEAVAKINQSVGGIGQAPLVQR
jgi:hypothetical protein